MDVELDMDPDAPVNQRMFKSLYSAEIQAKWENKRPPSFEKLMKTMSIILNAYFRGLFPVYFHDLASEDVSIKELICKVLLNDRNINVDTKQMLLVNWSAPKELKTIMEQLPLDTLQRNREEAERVMHSIRKYALPPPQRCAEFA